MHRATAKRWIARVRKTVHDTTRAKLRAALHIDSDELDSIMGLIESRLEASIHRVLGQDGPDDVG